MNSAAGRWSRRWSRAEARDRKKAADIHNLSASPDRGQGAHGPLQGRGGRAPAALPLTLKGRRAKEKGEAVRGSTPSVRPWHQPAPPTIPSSANPLTWESAAFPSHGELRTGLPKRWALSFSVRCRWRERCCERSGPFPRVSSIGWERLASQRGCWRPPLSES